MRCLAPAAQVNLEMPLVGCLAFDLRVSGEKGRIVQWGRRVGRGDLSQILACCAQHIKYHKLGLTPGRTAEIPPPYGFKKRNSIWEGNLKYLSQ